MPTLFREDQPICKPGHDPEDKRAPEGGAEVGYVEPWGNGSRQPEHERVDDEREESEGEDVYWQREDDERWTKQGVYDAENERGNERLGKILDRDARHEACHHHDRKRV